MELTSVLFNVLLGNQWKHENALFGIIALQTSVLKYLNLLAITGITDEGVQKKT